MAAVLCCEQITPALFRADSEVTPQNVGFPTTFAPHLDSRGAGYWLQGFKRIQAPPSPLRYTSTSETRAVLLPVSSPFYFMEME